jgi:hypothetical protein
MVCRAGEKINGKKTSLGLCEGGAFSFREKKFGLAKQKKKTRGPQRNKKPVMCCELRGDDDVGVSICMYDV